MPPGHTRSGSLLVTLTSDNREPLAALRRTPVRCSRPILSPTAALDLRGAKLHCFVTRLGHRRRRAQRNAAAKTAANSRGRHLPGHGLAA